MNPVKITLEKVVRGAWKRWKNQTLLYQAPHQILLKSSLKYRVGKYRCAIGAGLAAHEAARLDKGDAVSCSITMLVQAGHVEISDHDYGRVAEIQRLHDMAYQAAQDLYTQGTYKSRRACAETATKFEVALTDLYERLDKPTTA